MRTPKRSAHFRHGHEAHLSTQQDPPRAETRLSGPDEHRRRTQGSRLAPREGPRPTLRLSERAYRLTGIGTFDALFRAGRRRQGRWIELVVAGAKQPPGRVGLVVGRKALPRAVDRNRFKRKLREVLRRERPYLQGYDLIVRLKRAAPGVELDAAILEADGMIALLRTARPAE
jgi:ribonuclease P protein component